MRGIENKATFYIPVDKDGGEIAQAVASKAAHAFGSATLVPASSINGVFEQGSINLVIVHVPQTERVKFANWVTDMVKFIGLGLDLETVSVEINGTLGVYDKATNYA